MNLSEEELQKRVEANPSMNSNDVDIRSYQEVFRILKKEPAVKISQGFEDRIMRVIIENRKAGSSDFVWLALGIFLISLAFIVVVAFTGFNPDFGFLKAMADYKGLVIFGIAFIGFLNWLDKKVLRTKIKASDGLETV